MAPGWGGGRSIASPHRSRAAGSAGRCGRPVSRERETGVEHGVQEVADRINRDGDGCTEQTDQPTTERWAEGLRRSIALIESGIGLDQATPRDEAREQRLRGSERKHRERAERQEQHHQRPDLERPTRPQHRQRPECGRPADAAPHQDPLSPPPIGVHPGDQSQHRVGNELRSVHDTNGERRCLQFLNDQHRHRHGRHRGAERADRHRRPVAAERGVRHLPSPTAGDRVPSQHPVDDRGRQGGGALAPTAMSAAHASSSGTGIGWANGASTIKGSA